MNDVKIISVSPIERVFSITWKLSSRCNYDCMYCPNEWHSSTSVHPTLNEMQSYWKKVFEKTKQKELKYKISFTGGELTGNKDFLPFLQWLRKEYKEHIDIILLTTNGSATLKYYKKLFNLVENISFSVHSEHVNENKFFTMIADLANYIDENKFLHVNIMDEYWNKDRIELYKNFLISKNISHSVNKINYSLRTREIPIFKGKFDFDIQ